MSTIDAIAILRANASIPGIDFKIGLINVLDGLPVIRFRDFCNDQWNFSRYQTGAVKSQLNRKRANRVSPSIDIAIPVKIQVPIRGG